MRMPRIEMHSVQGKIGMNAENAKLSIHQRKAERQIRQPKAEMNIHLVPGKLDIDQSQAFAEENLKPVSQMISDYARRGKDAALKGIARRAEEGDTLMKIENGGHPIAELAKKDSSDPPVEFNIGWMPKSVFSVKYHYTPSNLSIQWSIHQPQISVTPQYPQYGYTPGSLNIYMRQWPSLTIQVVGGKFDENI